VARAIRKEDPRMSTNLAAPDIPRSGARWLFVRLSHCRCCLRASRASPRCGRRPRGEPAVAVWSVAWTSVKVYAAAIAMANLSSDGSWRRPVHRRSRRFQYTGHDRNPIHHWRFPATPPWPDGTCHVDCPAFLPVGRANPMIPQAPADQPHGEHGHRHRRTRRHSTPLGGWHSSYITDSARTPGACSPGSSVTPYTGWAP
jgi:hypothetical protein